MSDFPPIKAFDIIDNYRIIKTIANGGFGLVYFVRDVTTRQPAAMKIAKDRVRPIQMEVEHSVLKQLQGTLYFPHLYSSGRHNNNLYIVMELLGPSLSRIRVSLPDLHFSLSSCLRIGIETVCNLREFHSRGFVHRDIKPANFLIRLSSPTPISLVDFGLAKRFIDPQTGRPHNASVGTGFIGTARYASINAHYKMDLGPRDDMISWFFSMIELMVGELPWKAISDKAGILRMKEGLSSDELCANTPSQFVAIYDGLKILQYEEIPDYDMIIMKLTEVMQEFGIGTADPYDWDTLDEQTLSAMSIGPMMKRKVDEFEPRIETAIPHEAGGGLSDQLLLSSPSFATVNEERAGTDWRLCCCRKCNI
jgi:serine/threonine protein kinase